MEETNMKKIIATVLAMVMALALCTTAFAADKTSLKVDDYDFLNKSTNVSLLDAFDEDDLDDATLSLVAESKSTVTVNGETTVTITPAYYELKVGSYTYYAVIVDKSVANTKVVKGNKVVDYAFFDADITDFDVTDYATSTTVTKTIAGVKAADATCGDYVGEDVTFYVIKNKVYAATDEVANEATAFALLNGKLVAYNTNPVNPVDHDFNTDKTNTENGVVKSVYCDTCKKYIAVTKTIPDDSVAQYLPVEGLQGYYYQVGATGTAAGTTTNTTTSPKTFDAGIAMYVGMALTSVAGSAVVIGKKKEF